MVSRLWLLPIYIRQFVQVAINWTRSDRDSLDISCLADFSRASSTARKGKSEGNDCDVYERR